jgi:hypothetical protein
MDRKKSKGFNMSNYIPGEGYDRGFTCRMNGGQKPNQAIMATDPFWQEYATGWNDADLKIITEARKRNAVMTKTKVLKEIVNEKEI